MKQQYLCDMYINQMKVFMPIRNNYEIPEECLIEETFITDYENDIMDEEEIINAKNDKNELLKKREKELNKIKKLENEILKMNLKLEDI